MLSRINSALSPAFELAVRDDIIRKNPFKGLYTDMKKKVVTKPPEVIVLTQSQHKNIVKFVATNKFNQQWKNILIVFLGTGLRVGELVTLCWEDIDFDKREIHVKRTLSFDPKKGPPGTIASYTLNPTKTYAGTRTIDMYDSVYEALVEQKKLSQLKGGCKMAIDGKRGFVFFNRDSNIFNSKYLNTPFKKIQEAYNAHETKLAALEGREPDLVKFTLHALRRTYCTRLCEYDVSVKIIQDSMGHANFNTTMNIYTGVTKAFRQNETQKAKEAFNYD